MANLIRQRKAHLSGLGGFPHERLHQEKTLSILLTLQHVESDL
ncbi:MULTISPECIES: hypothetical protein [Moorena]|nr:MULTISPECIES: hypothetical protein [Moorena]